MPNLSQIESEESTETISTTKGIELSTSNSKEIIVSLEKSITSEQQIPKATTESSSTSFKQTASKLFTGNRNSYQTETSNTYDKQKTFLTLTKNQPSVTEMSKISAEKSNTERTEENHVTPIVREYSEMPTGNQLLVYSFWHV